MSLARAVRILKREVWLRRLPHGLVSWRYLWPGDARLAHRRLWWDGARRLPRPLWLVLELWLWLRWVGFEAWRSTWRTVRLLGSDIRARDGLSLGQQGWRTLSLALTWCIPPSDVYRFGLYRDPAAALDFVYGHELLAYHQWRSTERGMTRASMALLQDKHRQTEVLAADGVPMAPILMHVPRRAAVTLADRLKTGQVYFCKTCSGNRGIGAFTVWPTPDGLRGRLLDGAWLESADAVETAWRKLLALDDALIQPRLANHPELAPLAVGEDVITVRFISQWHGHDLNCLSATLEIPVGHDEKSGHPRYVILPISPETGQLRPFPEERLLTEQARLQMLRTWEQCEHGTSLPHWPELVAASYRAHRRFPDIWAIAWDWVITPEGPRLLEGNSGWGMVTPQLLQGGLLSTTANQAHTGSPRSSR
ncbi:MAG: sugar-transfer associated ATP-grasp domain-containing protein [Methylobacter sp.]